MTNDSSLSRAAVFGLAIGLGIAFAGLWIGNAITSTRAMSRFVSVKGLAERTVDADLAIWPISFQETGNDLTELHRRINDKRQVISSFLKQAGFAEDNLSFSTPRINDTQLYADAMRRPPYRYVAEASVTLRSTDVSAVKRAMETSGSLVGKGVVLVAQNWESRTQFLFTGLNSIKPEMIEQATKSAREAADKFAKDSGSMVGKIRTATQGLFTITDEDPTMPEKKQIRVVTTVEYFLDD